MHFASAQLSATAFSNWKKRPKLASNVFGAAQLICAVDDEQRQRFEQLCESAEKALSDKGPVRKPEIRIGGSLKLNTVSTGIDNTFVDQLKAAAGGRPIVLAASTHDPEEKLLLQVSQEAVRVGYPHLLIIAPRHIDRVHNIARLMPQAAHRQRPASAIRGQLFPRRQLW